MFIVCLIVNADDDSGALAHTSLVRILLLDYSCFCHNIITIIITTTTTNVPVNT